MIAQMLHSCGLIWPWGNMNLIMGTIWYNLYMNINVYEYYMNTYIYIWIYNMYIYTHMIFYKYIYIYYVSWYYTGRICTSSTMAPNCRLFSHGYHNYDILWLLGAATAIIEALSNFDYKELVKGNSLGSFSVVSTHSSCFVPIPVVHKIPLSICLSQRIWVASSGPYQLTFWQIFWQFIWHSDILSDIVLGVRVGAQSA